MTENPIIPDFASWHHGTLVLFATEAFIKMQDQRALIQQLRGLVAEHPEDAWKRALSEIQMRLRAAHQSGIDDWYLTLEEEITILEDRYEAPTRKAD